MCIKVEVMEDDLLKISLNVNSVGKLDMLFKNAIISLMRGLQAFQDRGGQLGS